MADGIAKNETYPLAILCGNYVRLPVVKCCQISSSQAEVLRHIISSNMRYHPHYLRPAIRAAFCFASANVEIVSHALLAAKGENAPIYCADRVKIDVHVYIRI